MTTSPVIIGKLISAMKASGLHPAEVSIRAGHIAVDDVLCGRDPTPRLSTILAIADVLDVTLDVLPVAPPVSGPGTHEPHIKSVVRAALERIRSLT